MAGETKTPIEAFIAYSHRDEELRQELEKHLALLKRQGCLSVWNDRRITAGAEWKEQIDAHLDSAGLILLLISSDFIASDYCYDIELKRALERHKHGEARVVPIILRSSDWQSAPFGSLLALPKDGQPVMSRTVWQTADDAWLDVVRGLRQVIESLSSPSTDPLSENERSGLCVQNALHESDRHSPSPETLYARRILRVYIASPSDFKDERDVIDDVAKQLNLVFDPFNIAIEIIQGESSIYMRLGGSDIRSAIDRQISDDCDLFLGILWTRFGSATSNAEPGTKEEFERVLARKRANPDSVGILMYFKRELIDLWQHDPVQITQVRDYRARVRNYSHCSEYCSKEDLRKLVTRHISAYIASTVCKYCRARSERI